MGCAARTPHAGERKACLARVVNLRRASQRESSAACLAHVAASTPHLAPPTHSRTPRRRPQAGCYQFEAQRELFVSRPQCLLALDDADAVEELRTLERSPQGEAGRPRGQLCARARLRGAAGAVAR